MINVSIFKKIGLNLNNGVFVFDGNSLTSGIGGIPYPTQLKLLEPFNSNGSIFWNKGVGAQQTSQMITDATTDIDIKFTNGVSNFVIVNEVGNDIYYNGNVRSAVDRFWQYCDGRKSAGFKVGIITLQDRSYTYYGSLNAFGDNEVQFRDKIILANQLMRNEYKDHADFIIDLGHNQYIGINENVTPSTNWNCYNTTYFTDRIHCTTTGYAIWASEVRRAILIFTGNSDLI
jgi:hypothetical protein